MRNWTEIEKGHRAFWQWNPVDRPLIQVIYDAYVDTELVAAAMGEGELLPHEIDPTPILPEYDKVAAAREQIGDDTIGVAEPLLGIPWLEAICGCRVMVADGKSLWPESPGAEISAIAFDEQNPWFRKLLDVIEVVVEHADGRYAVGLSHLRGPADILAALLGTADFFAAFYDAPERIARLAGQVTTMWLNVAWAEAEIVPRYRGGYGVRQFGLWAPDLAPWLQDDTSSMMSLDHYRHLFLDPMVRMSMFPYGVLHLHIPSLHLAEMFAQVPNVRAINLYFDSPTISLSDAMPTLQRLQARRMPLILAKDVYEGFTLDEYVQILDGLSPRGLSVHLKAESVEEGCAVMETVRAMAKT
jgi:hypothetical protein